MKAVSSSLHSRIGPLSAAVLFAGGMLASAQTLPNEPRRASGASVTAAFEGWFRNPDGTFSLLIGYYNRNQTQEVDVPVGPNNQIQPGGQNGSDWASRRTFAPAASGACSSSKCRAISDSSG